MRVTKLNSKIEILIKINKYKINWDGKSRSKLQFQAKQLLKPFWKNYLVGEEVTIPGSLMKIDILNFSKRIAVEVQGSQHNEFNKHFHNNSRANYLASIKRDMLKYKWLEQNNILLLELEEKDLKEFNPKLIQEKYGINII